MGLFTTRSATYIGVFAAVTILACSGCSPDQPDNLEDVQPSQATQENITELAQWLLPPQEAENARKAFVKRCVAKAGGKYEEASSELSLRGDVQRGLSTEQLKKTGYTPVKTKSQVLPVSDGKGKKAYVGDAQKGTVSASFMDFGSVELPANGCLAQSYQYIYGSAEDGLVAARLAPQVPAVVGDSIRENERYQDLLKQWSGCMKDAGYSEMETLHDAEDRAALISQKDVKKLVTTDVTCREKVNYDDSVQGIEDEYFESIYARVKQHHRKNLEKIHRVAEDNVTKDKDNPQDSSPIEITASPSEETHS